MVSINQFDKNSEPTSVPKTRNVRKTIPRHTINKWLKISNKEKFLKGGQ